MSTFDGFIKEFPNVCIDYFQKSNLNCTAYFLSHCHTDHMKGLNTDDFMNRLRSTPDIFIYCSEVTKTVIVNNGLYAVHDKIRVLPLRKPTMIEVPQLNSDPLVILVTIIPAGHCPGSVMFLFEGLECNVLYTGDFRLAFGDVRKLTQLHSTQGIVKRIDSLYLDTTFLNKLYTVFPSRQASLNAICDTIKSYLKLGENYHVNIRLPAKYGSEYIFINVSKIMKMKIHIPEEQFLFYRSVPEIGDSVTDSCLSTRIHAFYYEDALKEQFRAYGVARPIVKCIKPCAMSFCLKQADQDIVKAIPEKNLIKVCYSSHSSFQEIKDLILYLKPSTIIPCVTKDTKTVTSLIREICDAKVRIQRNIESYQNK